MGSGLPPGVNAPQQQQPNPKIYEKKARQHAALQVLQRLGYSVSFDQAAPPPR